MRGVVGHQPHTEPLPFFNAGYQGGWGMQLPAGGRGAADTSNNAGYQGGWGMQPPAGGRGAADTSNNVNENVQLSHLRQQYEWQLRKKSEELRDMQQRMNQLEIETAQIRASWEIERRNLVRQIGHYGAALERYCIPLEEAGNPSYKPEEPPQYFMPFKPSAPSQWGVDAAGGATQTAGAIAGSAAKSGGAVSSGGAGIFAGSSQQAGSVGNTPGGGYAPSGATVGTGAGRAADGLDSKMRALNNLLREGQDQQQHQPPQQLLNENQNENQNPKPSSGAAFLAEGGNDDMAAVPEVGSYNSIASTLREMFPHANIRTSTRPTVRNVEIDGLDPDVEKRDQEVVQAEEENEPNPSHAVCAAATTPEVEVRAAGIENHVRRLERSTGGLIDERSMHALLDLTTREAKWALAKVEELVQDQGGQCFNLSSVLQSVCRKIVKDRPNRDDDFSQAACTAATTPEVEARAAGIENHVRRIERTTGGHVDDRAMRGLLNLTTKEAKLAMEKVEELLQAQSDECWNLSSILQSVCRKMLKNRPNRDHDLKTGSANGDSSSRVAAIRTDGRIRSTGGPSGRAWQLDEDGDAFDSSDSNGESGMKVIASTRATSWHQRAALHDFRRGHQGM